MWEITWALCSPATGVMGEGNSEDGRIGDSGQWQNLNDGRKCWVWLDFCNWFILWRARTYVNLDGSYDRTHLGRQIAMNRYTWRCGEVKEAESGCWTWRHQKSWWEVKCPLEAGIFTSKWKDMFPSHIENQRWHGQLTSHAVIRIRPMGHGRSAGLQLLPGELGCGLWYSVWSHVSLKDGINWFPELYPDTEKLTSLWGCKYFLLFPLPNNVSEFWTFFLYYLTFNRI